MAIHFGDSTSIDSGGSLGKVLQVISSTRTDAFSTNAAISSPQAIGDMHCTITPASTSNKILIIAHIGMATTTNNDFGCRFHFYKDNSQISGAIGDAAGNRVRVAFSTRTSSKTRFSSPSMTYLDSPSSTSALAYALRCSVEPSGGFAQINQDGHGSNAEEFPRTISTFTVMEIKG